MGEANSDHPVYRRPTMTAATQLPEGGWRLLVPALLTIGRSGAHALPPTQRLFKAPELAIEHLRAYQRHFKLPESSGVPLTYLYPLAQRAQLALMLDSEFPYSAVGMVHTANHMRLFKPVQQNTPFEIAAFAQDEAPSKSGARFVSFDCEIRQLGERVATCTSQYLAKRGPHKANKREGKTVDELNTAPSQPQRHELEQYVLSLGAGRHYARLSGDYNPIHLWAWSARLLGFKRPIIHGMHTVGFAAGCLGRQGTHARQTLTELDVKFLKPISLPSTVRIVANGATFAALSGDVLALEGRYAFAAL
jgi:acyl dehydratase